MLMDEVGYSAVYIYPHAPAAGKEKGAVARAFSASPYHAQTAAAGRECMQTINSRQAAA